MKARLTLRPLWAGMLAAGILAGCAIGPDYQRPATVIDSLPAAHVEAAGQGRDGQAPAGVARAWWTLFNDAQLTALVDAALRHNADLAVAVARVEEADGVLREAGAALLPQVDASASDARSRISTRTATPLPATAPIVRENLRFTVGTSFELDLWGKLRRTSEAARAQALATRYARDTLALSLAGLVTQQYLALRSLDAQLELGRDSLLAREESLRLMQLRVDAGLSSALDVQTQQAALAAAGTQLAELRQQRDLVAHQLQLLSGQPVPAPDVRGLASLPVPPVPPAGLPSALLDNRPDVRQAEELLVAANARIGVAKAAFLPSISLTGFLGSESAALTDLFKSPAAIWSAGASISLPIFSGGRLSAREDQATAQQRQALATYRKAAETAYREINDALSVLRETAVSDRAQQQRQQALQGSLTVVNARYQAGYAGRLDWLEARRTANDAALSAVRARQARLVAVVDVMKALGGGWQGVEVQPGS